MLLKIDELCSQSSLKNKKGTKTMKIVAKKGQFKHKYPDKDDETLLRERQLEHARSLSRQPISQKELEQALNDLSDRATQGSSKQYIQDDDYENERFKSINSKLMNLCYSILEEKREKDRRIEKFGLNECKIH